MMIEGKAARRFHISGGKPYKKNEAVSFPADQFEGFEAAGLVRRVEKKPQPAKD